MPAVSYLSLGLVKVGVNDTWELDWYLVLYYIVCILIAANLGGWLWNRGQAVAAVLSLALLLLVYIFFGLRWFSTPDTGSSSCGSGGGDPNAGVPATNPFPPSINLCPDFMVAYTEPSGRILCYDVNDTYVMKKGTGGGLITGLTVNGVGGQSGYVRKDPTQSGASRYPILTNLSSLSSDPLGKYLRWEGVYNGTTVDPARSELQI